MSVICTCCGTPVTDSPIYVFDQSPVLNNVVYDSVEQARTCVVGSVRLGQCPDCGFVFNAHFDERLIHYNASYDSTRTHSQVYRDHLNALVDVCQPWLDDGKYVVEIGCGNGDFLRSLSDATGCLGAGYDRTYEGEPSYADRISFRSDYFDPRQVDHGSDLIILRHVLEHIPQPYEFLKELCDPDWLKNGSRILIEVPDFEWILKRSLYYDITYEHCNYFTEHTLSALCASLGFEIDWVTRVFDGQYLLLSGVYKEDPTARLYVSCPDVDDVSTRFASSKQMLEQDIQQSQHTCVWGASGKGVIFLSNLSRDLLDQVDYVVDINPAKQRKFLPVSGKRVDPPEVLKNIEAQLLVILMNDIYKQEICNQIESMQVKSFSTVAL